MVDGGGCSGRFIAQKHLEDSHHEQQGNHQTPLERMQEKQYGSHDPIEGYRHGSPGSDQAEMSVGFYHQVADRSDYSQANQFIPLIEAYTP